MNRHKNDRVERRRPRRKGRKSEAINGSSISDAIDAIGCLEMREERDEGGGRGEFLYVRSEGAAASSCSFVPVAPHEIIINTGAGDRMVLRR